MRSLLRPVLWLPMVLCACVAAGWFGGDWHRDNAWLKKQTTELEAAAKQLTAEQARGDALTTALLASQSQIDQLSQEAHRGIKTETTGRACLGSGALRVLNRAPGLRTELAPASGAVATGGAPAPAADDAGTPRTDTSDGGDEFATDTQVGDWAIDAGAQYEVCRTRLDKLIDWHGAP